MSLYRVNPDWPHDWRGHAPGEKFEASLEPDEEARALARGHELVERREVRLDPKRTKAPRKRKPKRT